MEFQRYRMSYIIIQMLTYALQFKLRVILFQKHAVLCLLRLPFVHCMLQESDLGCLNVRSQQRHNWCKQKFTQDLGTGNQCSSYGSTMYFLWNTYTVYPTIERGSLVGSCSAQSHLPVPHLKIQSILNGKFSRKRKLSPYLVRTFIPCH